MKSQKYSDESVLGVQHSFGSKEFCELLGISNGDFVDNEDETRCYCPVCNDRSKMSFVVEKDTGRGYCTNLSCQASSMNAGGADLVEMYALAKGVDPDEGLEEIADKLNIQLAKKSNGAGMPVAGREDFKYLEVGHFQWVDEGEAQGFEPAEFEVDGIKGQGRGVLISRDELPEFAAKYKTDSFRSHFLYNTSTINARDNLAEQGQLELLGDFYIVFNATSSAEIVHAINQAIDLVERFKENYDIPYDAVSVYYTNRNIEVHIDFTVFDIEPTSNLHEIYRRMACAVIGVDPLKPERSAAFSQIDLNVYRHDYLYNIPGTQVSTSGRDIFKIRMSYNAFKKMSYQRLHEFSLRRPDLPERERFRKVSIKAREFFNSVKTSMVRDTSLDESDKIASLFYRISESDEGFSTLKELAPTLLRRLFDESRQVLETPSEHLNRALAGGLYPGHLYVVAGFPGSGMTAFAMQLMNTVAANQDAHCMFVGFQQGVEELFKHSLSSLGRIAAAEIDEKRQNPADLYDDKDFNRRIFAAYENYQQFADNITILEGTAASNLNQLTSLVQEKKEQIRATTGKSGSVLLIVDSLQLMVAMMRAQLESGAVGEDWQASMLAKWDVDTLTSRLKAMARELDITVLATFEHFTSHRGLFSELSENDPVVHDLLFSTQFADAAMVLVRQGNSLLNLKDYYQTHLIGTPQEDQIEVIFKSLNNLEQECRSTKDFEALVSEFIVLDIVKNRHGPRDKVLYIYHKPISSFQPLSYLEQIKMDSYGS